MPEKFVRVYTHEWENEDAFVDALGECDPKDVTHEDYDCTSAEDPEIGPVDYACNALTENGLTEPSSSMFTPHEWYTDPDGGDTQYPSQCYTELSGHLHGFTADECRAIWDRVTRGRYDRVSA